MNLLLDTQVFLWSSDDTKKLRPAVRRLIEADDASIFFSVVSLWEIAVKRSLGREDFDYDPRVLRAGALAHGYQELTVLAQHALAVTSLPPLHRDPFDRLLLCQSQVEGLTLVTSDAVVMRYPISTLRA